MRPSLLGRHVTRVRLLGSTALLCSLGDRKALELLLDVGRDGSGLYLLARDEARTLEALPREEPAAAARQALLLFRKHLAGARLLALQRVRGQRAIVIDLAEATLVLRPSPPGLTLAKHGLPVASLGGSPMAWPAPAADETREIEALAEAELLEVRSLDAATRMRELLRRYPPLGRGLAEALLEGRLSLPALRQGIRDPSPTLLLRRPLHDLDDADLAQRGSVAVAPFGLPGSGHAAPAASWREAMARSLVLLARGAAFGERQRARLAVARARLKRTQALESHLLGDQGKLPDPAELRRQAEALLASPGSVSRGARAAEVADPYEPGRTLTIPLDPAQDGIENAQRIFARARRAESGRVRITSRLDETRAARAAAEAALRAIGAARTLAELAPSAGPTHKRTRARTAGKRLHYLTTHGLSLWVGRGARENQQLTFEQARPDDLWFHARDAPGAHVVLRDNEGRSQADDLREAAEVAAFFSAAAADAAVEVHVARRKHVRPGKGGPGRVVVGHSETLRVKPKDPEGRLRRR